MLDKFELKSQLIDLSDALNMKVGEIMAKATDEETGEIRNRIYREAQALHEALKREIYKIY